MKRKYVAIIDCGKITPGYKQISVVEAEPYQVIIPDKLNTNNYAKEILLSKPKRFAGCEFPLCFEQRTFESKLNSRIDGKLNTVTEFKYDRKWWLKKGYLTTFSRELAINAAWNEFFNLTLGEGTHVPLPDSIHIGGRIDNREFESGY